MGQAPRELTPLESALHFFGAQLRYWRTLRTLSQTELGRRTHDSDALIGKIEKGERFPSLALAHRLDAVLDTGGALAQLWPQVEHERVTRGAPSDAPARQSSGDLGELGLVWSATPQATVAVVAELWRSTLDRRSILLSAAWVASAFAGPTREWLLNRQDEVVQGWAGRRVGQGDIDALWEMCATFTDVDQRLGGGYARSTLLHYVNQVVLPLLEGSYDDAIGRELMAATARLCDLCGYMCWDSGQQGLAQRYFIQALRLAQASGNRALGAHILVDMATQAHSLGDASQALDLASAGLDHGSPLTAARCAVWQGRAHALLGDHRACAQSCSIAERALDRAVSADERVWFKLFTTQAMTHEMLHAAADLSRHDDVQRLAPEVMASASAGGLARRRVLGTTALARSYLPSQGNPHSDVDQACELLGQVIPLLSSLHSTHSLDQVNSVRRALAPHAERSSVQELEERFRSTIPALATPV
ncbi:MAG: helix-turn-helix domain-containing protein [Pseudonocardiaceae bacterium]